MRLEKRKTLHKGWGREIRPVEGAEEALSNRGDLFKLLENMYLKEKAKHIIRSPVKVAHDWSRTAPDLFES